MNTAVPKTFDEKVAGLFTLLDDYVPPVGDGVVQRKRGQKKLDLYFIVTEDGRWVKIGHARDSKRRLSELQAGNPQQLTLLASVPRQGHLESALHRQFAHLQIRGEWFEYTKEIDDCIEEMLAK